MTQRTDAWEKDEYRRWMEEMRRTDPMTYLEILAWQGLREDLEEKHREVGGEGGGA